MDRPAPLHGAGRFASVLADGDGVTADVVEAPAPEGTSPGAAAEDEFHSLFEAAYGPVSHAVWLVVPDRAMAEEVTRRAFVDLYRHWGTVRHQDRPDQWVRRAAVRRALRKAPRTTGAGDAPRPPDPELLAALRTLPPRQRAVVVLVHLEERPLAEVADLVGCSTAAGLTHLHQARNALAGRLGLEVGDEVDERLRTGLALIDHELPRPVLGAAHARVVHDGRRSARRRQALALLAVAALVAAVLAVTRVGGTPEGHRDRGVDPPTGLPGLPTAEIDGVYRSRPVSFGDLAATLRDAGLARDVPALHRVLGPVSGQRLLLTVRDGTSVLRVPGTDVRLLHVDTLDTHEVRMVSMGEATVWRTTFRTALSPLPARESASAPSRHRAYTLTLTLLDHVGGRRDGASSEAWMTALFTTVPFDELR